MIYYRYLQSSLSCKEGRELPQLHSSHLHTTIQPYHFVRLHRYRGTSAGDVLLVKRLWCGEMKASAFLIIDKVRFTDHFLSSHWSDITLVSDKSPEALRVFRSCYRDWSIGALPIDVLPGSPPSLSTYLSLRSHWYRKLRPFVLSAFPTMAARKPECA